MELIALEWLAPYCQGGVVVKYTFMIKGLILQLGDGDLEAKAEHVSVEVEASAEEYMNSVDLLKEALHQLQSLLS